MSNFLSGQRSLRQLAATMMVLLAGALAGCAAPASYVVLLDNGDQTTGKVVVTGKQGAVLLTQARQATLFTTPAEQTFVVTDEIIQRDFGRALDANPVKPSTFLLYFEAGGGKLTAASQEDIPKILAEIAGRTAPDISIIGHTDTVGDEAGNERLGLNRATLIAGLLSEAKLDADHVAIESHGKKNLLVKTPDETAEARNRRVEVTIR